MSSDAASATPQNDLSALVAKPNPYANGDFDCPLFASSCDFFPVAFAKHDYASHDECAADCQLIADHTKRNRTSHPSIVDTPPL